MYSYPSRKPIDSLQIRWCEDVSAHHGALEARGIGLDAVKHWPNSGETGWRWEEEEEVMVHNLAN